MKSATSANIASFLSQTVKCRCPKERSFRAGYMSLGFMAAIILIGDSRLSHTVAAPPQVQTSESQAAMSPADALERLREGNARFVAGQSKVRNLPAKVRATAEGQYPFAVI